MSIDTERVRQNAQKAITEDLLDRVTVFRAGIEPEAIEIIEAELNRRGITPDQILEFESIRRKDGLIGDEVPQKCSYCDRPAIARAWGFAHGHSLISIWPWRFNYCHHHHQSRWQLFAR